MSTERCEHGNVISDTAGNEYRCASCNPLTEADLERELQATEQVLEERLELRDRRIAELERVVAELAKRAGVTFSPPPPGDE